MFSLLLCVLNHQINIFRSINLSSYLQHGCIFQFFYVLFVAILSSTSSDNISDWSRWHSQGSFCVWVMWCQSTRVMWCRKLLFLKSALTEPEAECQLKRDCWQPSLLYFLSNWGFEVLSSQITQIKPGFLEGPAYISGPVTVKQIHYGQTSLLYSL